VDIERKMSVPDGWIREGALYGSGLAAGEVRGGTMEHTQNEHLRQELADVAIAQAVEAEKATGPVKSSQADTDQLEAARFSPVADTSSEEPADPSETEQPGQRRDKEHRLLANVYSDPIRCTVTFLLDDVTANTVIYAVQA
jgi:hypothetical protein